LGIAATLRRHSASCSDIAGAALGGGPDADRRAAALVEPAPFSRSFNTSSSMA